MERILKKKYLSDVLFLNGALGVLIAPIRAPVWEPTERFPITGDGATPPEGAPIVPTNFRKTFLIGRELANAIDKTIANGKPLPPREFIFKESEFYTRVTNIKFRIGMAVVRGQRSMFSYSKREAYICERANNSPVNCVSDGFRNHYIQDWITPVRLGEYIKTITTLVDLGPVRIISVNLFLKIDSWGSTSRNGNWSSK
jgi:hypothetical protein